MESTPQTSSRSTTTIMRLEEALNVCHNFNQNQVTRYLELHQHFNSLEKDYEKLLNEKEDLVRALELKQGQLDGDLHEDNELTDNDTGESISVLNSAFEVKHSQLTSVISRCEEDNKKLLKEKEDLSSQIRVLESKQHQLNVELHEKEQQLRDKEEEVQSLKNSLEFQREDSTKKMDELQKTWMDEQYKRNEHMLKSVNDNHRLQSEVDALTDALKKKEDECGNLKKQLWEKNDKISTIRTNMERSIADLERMMATKLEEAAEEKSALQSEYEKKLSRLTSVVRSWEEGNKRLLKKKEDLSSQIRVLESKQYQLNSELYENNRQLRDKKDMAQTLENCLQSQSKGPDQRLNGMLFALGACVEKHHKPMIHCVSTTDNLGLEEDTLTSALDLKVAEFGNPKKKLQERNDEVTTIRTNLEKSKADLEKSMAVLESMMTSKLEKVAEETSCLPEKAVTPSPSG